MKNLIFKLLPLAVLVLTLIYLFRDSSQDSRQATAIDSSAKQPDTKPPSQQSSQRRQVPQEAALSKSLVAAKLTQLRALTVQLQQAGSEADKKELYQQLVDFINSDQNPKELARAMVAFLKEGSDATTALPFAVGPDGGLLETAPTVRTLLLNHIMQKDQGLGLQISMTIMDELTTADEYALSLRNFARGPFPLPAVESRFATLMQQQDWLLQPSAGLYHSFDFAVALSSNAAFDTIVGVLEQGGEVGKNFERPFRLAADRIMLRNEAMVLEKYLQDPEGFLRFEHSEQNSYRRGSILSRMDITRPQGQQALVAYLNAPQLDEEELVRFVNHFPNANYFRGNRLASRGESHRISQILARDKKTLRVLKSLVKNKKIPPKIGEKMIENLTKHLK